MSGMDRRTGKAIDRTAHILQSIGEILSTPQGSRVMLRDYGVYLQALIDAPANALFISRTAAAVFDALERWEPRVVAQKVEVSASAEGKVVCAVTLKDRATAQDVTASTVLGGAV